MRWLIFCCVLELASLADALPATASGETPRKALVAALIQVESSGNDQAIGDKQLADKAYGCLQIRQPVCDDVNHRYGTNYRAKDMLGDRSLSVRVCYLYMAIYATKDRLGREPTDRDMARIWNGGPNGWKAKKTVAYWAKVRQYLSAEREG